MTRIEPTPLDAALTVRRQVFRHASRPENGSRGEITRAVSRDGEWTYMRDAEERGRWHIRHRDGATLWDAATNLRAARLYTASGGAAAELPAGLACSAGA